MNTHIRCRASYAYSGHPIVAGPSRRAGGSTKESDERTTKSVPPFVTKLPQRPNIAQRSSSRAGCAA